MFFRNIFGYFCCRSPYGERGLKFKRARNVGRAFGSLPIRGAWIEIKCRIKCPEKMASRSPYGERGLKYNFLLTGQLTSGRSPYGERGLKLLDCIPLQKNRFVAPHTGSVD